MKGYRRQPPPPEYINHFKIGKMYTDGADIFTVEWAGDAGPVWQHIAVRWEKGCWHYDEGERHAFSGEYRKWRELPNYYELWNEAREQAWQVMGFATLYAQAVAQA